MDAVRLGLIVRALRRRRGWTQARLAQEAGVSQAAVSRCERGDADALTGRTLRKITDALGARLTVTITWHGEEVDRLLDGRHADIVETLIRLLRSLGWEVVPEATFSVYGERGSIDILAYHPATGALLVIEVKSVVPDMQAMLSSMDRKVRHAPAMAKARGWKVRTVSRLLVLPDERTPRRRVDAHAATIDGVMPLRTVAVRRWLGSPVGAAIGGVLFVRVARPAGGRHRVRVDRRS